MKLTYKKDKDREDILTDSESGEFQVMMEWEKPYMEALVDKLKPSGDVLEIGFGLGYSADAIQKYDINTHTIIERDPEVLKELREWAKKQKHRVTVVEGRWQEKLPMLDQHFDSFFMDDYPFDDDADPKDVRFLYFYFHIIQNNVNKDARFTWFCSRSITWPCNMLMRWDSEEYNINIPQKVSYINENEMDALPNKLYLPLVTFTCSSPILMRPVIIEKYTSENSNQNDPK